MPILNPNFSEQHIFKSFLKLETLGPQKCRMAYACPVNQRLNLIITITDNTNDVLFMLQEDLLAQLAMMQKTIKEQEGKLKSQEKNFKEKEEQIKKQEREKLEKLKREKVRFERIKKEEEEKLKKQLEETELVKNHFNFS